MIDKTAVQYLLISRELDNVGKVYVCICLLYPLATGIGASRAMAFENMSDKLDALPDAAMTREGK